MRRAAPLLLGALAALVGALLAAGPASARVALDPEGDDAGLRSTVVVGDCSGALVRGPEVVPDAPALLLTNGHCHAYLGGDEVLVDQPVERTGTLLDAVGERVAEVRADRLLLATMTGTDLALYRLDETWAQLAERTGATPLVLATEPTDRADVRALPGLVAAVPSSRWRTTYSCVVDAVVPTLREAQWTWADSLRFDQPDAGCATIPGTSGSPVLDVTTREVVGINNTLNTTGASCTLDNPCEVGPDGGTRVEQGRNYGQQTWGVTTCLVDGRFDLDAEGCVLTPSTS